MLLMNNNIKEFERNEADMCIQQFLLNNVLLLNYIQMKPMQMISDNLAS
jgi:hypothetical protein